MSELLSIVLIVAAVGYVLVSRFRGQPIRLRRLVVLPLVLAVIGGAQLANGAPAGMTATNWLFLVGDGVLLLALGALRGNSVRLYPRDGYLWMRYRPATLAWWGVTILARVVLVLLGHLVGATVAVGGASMLLTVGLSLLGEAAVLVPRALSGGTPLAPDDRGSRRTPSRIG